MVSGTLTVRVVATSSLGRSELDAPIQVRKAKGSRRRTPRLASAMPVAGIVSDITTWVTDAIGSYGLYAVFLLMLIDAVFPAASEVVMVYGGAVASGAFAGQAITLFGYHFESGLPAYLAVAIAGTVGYLIGSIGGWALGTTSGARGSSVTAGGCT